MAERETVIKIRIDNRIRRAQIGNSRQDLLLIDQLIGKIKSMDGVLEVEGDFAGIRIVLNENLISPHVILRLFKESTLPWTSD